MRWCKSKNDDTAESSTEEAEDLLADANGDGLFDGDEEAMDEADNELDEEFMDEADDEPPLRKKQQRSCGKCKKAIGVCTHPGRYGHLRFI